MCPAGQARLHRIGKAFLHPVEYDGAGQHHHYHYYKAVAQRTPAKGTRAQESVPEGFND